MSIGAKNRSYFFMLITANERRITMATKPTYEQPTEYKSDYQGQMDSALDKVVNREAFTYDPLKDVSYQSLAKIYQKQGEQAAKNTMGDAASLNGGYGSSYAVTASQQARNDYNQMLASQIPSLKESAYNQYMNEQSLNLSSLDALRAADDTAYGRYRDDVSDNQYKYGIDYDAYRDSVADSQWKKTYDRSVYESDRDFKYGKSRDEVADEQWAKEYALSKKSAATSSRSSRSGYLGSFNFDGNLSEEAKLAAQGVGRTMGAFQGTVSATKNRKK